MLMILLAATTGQVPPAPAPAPRASQVPCRGPDGRFRLKCMPAGTVVKMDRKAAPTPAHHRSR